MRALLTALCRLLLRIFFRRIDVIGFDRVPDSGPVLFVLNHPNGLLDPLFIVCLSPRPVVFLAKAPLFSTFLVKHFVRAFECLPVYRESDGLDRSKNRASIEAAIEVLARGRALALFPEGKSHSEPHIEPLKTGAARIALAASAGAEQAVVIVPVGLDYPAKTTFRSRALLVYGEPLVTPRVELDADFRPPIADAEALTERIAEALAALTLQARDHEAIELARTTSRIWTAADHDDAATSMAGAGTQTEIAGRFERELILLSGHAQLETRAPQQVAAVVDRIRRYSADAELLGLRVDQSVRVRRSRLIGEMLLLLVMAGPALVGMAIHAPAYRLVDFIAHRVAKQAAEVLATLKLIAGLLFFPASWLLLTLAIAHSSGWTVALIALALMPPSGWLALRFIERLSTWAGRARAAWVLLTRRDVAGWLVRERAGIRAAILELAPLLEREG